MKSIKHVEKDKVAQLERNGEPAPKIARQTDISTSFAIANVTKDSGNCVLSDFLNALDIPI